MAKRRRVNSRDIKQIKKIESLLESTKSEKVPNPIDEAVEVKIQTVNPSLKNKPKYLPATGRRIKVEDIGLTDHGLERAIERLNLKRTSHNEVLSYLRNKLVNSIHIGRITSVSGNESEMFAFNNMSIQLSPDFKRIITVLHYNKLSYNPASDKVKCLMHKEFRKLDRAEKARVKQLQLYTYESEVEVSLLKLKIHKSKSMSVKLSSKARIAALETRLEELKAEVEKIKCDKRQVAYALVSVI